MHPIVIIQAYRQALDDALEVLDKLRWGTLPVNDYLFHGCIISCVFNLIKKIICVLGVTLFEFYMPTLTSD